MNLNRLKTTAAVFLFLTAIVLITALIAPNTIQTEKSIIIQAPADFVYYNTNLEDSVQTRPPWFKAETLYFKTFKGGYEKIILAEKNGSTKARLALTNKYKFPLNAFIAVIPVKRRMQTRIENRLDALKNKCEEDMKVIDNYQIRNIRFPETQYAAVRTRIYFNKIENYFEENSIILRKALKKQNTIVTGVPCGILFPAGTEGLADIAAAIPFTEKIPEGFEIISMPVQAGYELDFTEPYDQIYKAYFALNALFKTENTEIPSMIMEAFIDKGLVKIIFF